jgi:hypothetical protein
MGFVWFSESAAPISLKSMNQLVTVVEKFCFLSGTDLIFKYYLDELWL